MSKNLLILEFSPGAHIMYTTNKEVTMATMVTTIGTFSVA